MATLPNKIRLYLDRKVDFLKDVILQDDGDGVVYIKEWHVEEAQPTEEQLNAFESQANDIETANKIIGDRKNAYPTLREFVEAYTEKEIGENNGKWDAYVINYNKVRSDNPKN